MLGTLIRILSVVIPSGHCCPFGRPDPFPASDQTGFTENNGLKNGYLTNYDVFLTAIDHLHLRGSSIFGTPLNHMYRDFVNKEIVIVL